MTNLLLTIQYDGTDFCGWIIQKKQKTIQGEIEKVFQLITKKPIIKLIGASKTDSGVHALDQKAIITIDFKPLNLIRLKEAINKALPKSIFIKKIEFAKKDFNIRNVKYKIYTYTINDSEVDIFTQRFELTLNKDKIKINSLQKICNEFVGEHDFYLFSGLKKEEKELINTIRKIDYIKVKRNKEEKIVIVFKSKGFIRYQIRMIMAACIYAYNNKRIDIKEIQNKLSNKGEKWPIVLDAKGLCLNKIKFNK